MQFASALTVSIAMFVQRSYQKIITTDKNRIYSKIIVQEKHCNRFDVD